MSKLKKLINTVAFIMIMTLSTSTAVFASNYIDSKNILPTVSQTQQKLPADFELPSLEGESTSFEDEQGNIIAFECISISDKSNLTRATLTTKSISYNVKINGTAACTVNLSCKYYSDGMNGYISSLVADYKNVNSGYSVSWSTPSDARWLCCKFLDVYAAPYYYYFGFSASYEPNSGTVIFDASEI